MTKNFVSYVYETESGHDFTYRIANVNPDVSEEAILDAGRKGIEVLLPKAGKPTKLKAAKLISQDETVIDVDVDAE